MSDWRDYGNGIIAFDSGYVRSMLAAIHMLVEKERVALIDTGSNSSLLNAQAALRKAGLSAAAVEYIFLTHIHLDHAGGAGAMMQAFPNAALVLHPRALRHMAQPAALVAGVAAVYGADYVRRVYGDIIPVDPRRMIPAHDGQCFSLAGRKLTCLDTPGHARHHICIVDHGSGGIFSGDTFGISYREFDVNRRPFIFPSTTPTQFDPEAMQHSIERLLKLLPSAMYLTHYGQVSDVAKLGGDLRRRLDAMVDLALARNDADTDRHGAIKRATGAYLLSELRAHGCLLPEATILDILDTDLELNAQGLAQWLDAGVALTQI